MKSCQIWGNLSADRVDDQYPTVTACDDCAEEYQKRHHEDDEPAILHVWEYESCYGDSCHFCEKTKEEEDEEKKLKKK